MRWGRPASWLGVALVAGCASVSLPQPSLERTAQSVSVDGRLSVRYRDLASDKEELLSGRFEWTRNGDDLSLSLLDPLGQTVALIRAAPGRASITFRDGRRVDGETPEALTRETLGWTVPLSGMREWIDGRAAPGSEATSLPDGRLRQDRWTIRFTPVDGAPADAPPRRIDLSFPGPPAEIEMRLVVDRRGGG